MCSQEIDVCCLSTTSREQIVILRSVAIAAEPGRVAPRSHSGSKPLSPLAMHMRRSQETRSNTSSSHRIQQASFQKGRACPMRHRGPACRTNKEAAARVGLQHSATKHSAASPSYPFTFYTPAWAAAVKCLSNCMSYSSLRPVLHGSVHNSSVNTKTLICSRRSSILHLWSQI
jgi:hypothetical protein